jgi:hypothetical protein
MSKDLERAKQFQRSLWEANGRDWAESDFTDTWVLSPMGADWDKWQLRGLMPIDFCPLCGEDDLSGGVTITKQFSALNVQIPHCKDCSERHSDFLPSAEHRVQGGRLGGLVVLLVVFGLVVGLAYLIFR